ncbi:MAG: hypothetical protein IPP46_20160 [Bacteroidetes bacterium]|nr:hypothetical protein [Bacteroidota bacterium]
MVTLPIIGSFASASSAQVMEEDCILPQKGTGLQAAPPVEGKLNDYQHACSTPMGSPLYMANVNYKHPTRVKANLDREDYREI